MILVAASQAEEPVVREFFELFKTPWEFYRDSNQKGDVLLSTNPVAPRSAAKLVLIYSNASQPGDGETVALNEAPRILVSRDRQFPVYKKCTGFARSTAQLQDESSGTALISETTKDGSVIVRIGYNLFEEILHLLTEGQPEQFASFPTLESHIALLRDLVLEHGISVVEVPPIPTGYRYIACLTHDFDHVGICNHRFDHTILGFLYRATIGSSVDVCRGRKTIHQLGRNYRAALSLPLVHLGLAEDFWYAFQPYVTLENGLPSTFFLIPKRDDPGKDRKGESKPKRAARYDVRELSSEIQLLRNEGKEIGVHGIDAWRDAVQGRNEFNRIASLTGKSELGIRMHWLYFDSQSPSILEESGFSYDSTVGYNGTVGFRAGTAQVYRPLSTQHLLELPMHLMDTAMFYPSYLNLTPTEAQTTAVTLIENFQRDGGAITINWHDRSVVPERLWDSTYVFILDHLKSTGAWIATAAQAVAWFRRRRNVKFTVAADDSINLDVPSRDTSVNSKVPEMLLRVHRPTKAGKPGYVDSPLNADGQVCLTT